jgi:hypothetical protein
MKVRIIAKREETIDMKQPQCTIYAKSAGLEIGPYEKRQEGKPREGRISLRFFTMENGSSQQIRFVAHPRESYALFRMITKVFQEGTSETLTHKFEGTSGEVVTKLGVEKYERNNKTGYAFTIQRGNESINIAASAGDFLYAGEYLRHLALSEAWVEQTGERKAPQQSTD